MKIGEVAEVNPKIPNREDISDDLQVQFLPMKLVEALTGNIHLTETR
ncbi:MAG: Type restriction endonuclease subunit [Segetibacter sp.]|nr:Type restriction endonuclease subunit [Segetibacter sp.]